MAHSTDFRVGMGVTATLLGVVTVGLALLQGLALSLLLGGFSSILGGLSALLASRGA